MHVNYIERCAWCHMLQVVTEVVKIEMQPIETHILLPQWLYWLVLRPNDIVFRARLPQS